MKTIKSHVILFVAVMLIVLCNTSSVNADVTSMTRGISSVIEKYLEPSKGMVLAKHKKKHKTTGTIFVGDSRFVGMNNVCDVSYPMVAKVGKGYNWFISDGMDQIKQIKHDHPKDKWRIVCNLGVNDLGNIDKYIDLYTDLSKDYKIFLVSVNPVEGHVSVSNTSIDRFNEKLKQIDGITYIDTNKYLNDHGFDTTDGLHYTKQTYQTIYNYITSKL